jgi:hypothetical protein
MGWHVFVCQTSSVGTQDDSGSVHVSQEPLADVAKKAVAAFAAAAVALTPLAAGATGSGIMPSRNRAEDKAARSFLDSQGASEARVPFNASLCIMSEPAPFSGVMNRLPTGLVCMAH